MTVREDQYKGKLATGLRTDQNSKGSHISIMPYEILEQVASCVAIGADLVNWILTSLT
jgi:hypothetical protein